MREVVTRGERRRGWSDEERARILTEAMEPGAVVAHVARPRVLDAFFFQDQQRFVQQVANKTCRTPAFPQNGDRQTGERNQQVPQRHTAHAPSPRAA